MRSFTSKTLLIASLLSALPFAGAYANSGALDRPTPATMQGPRLEALLNQVQGVEHGIADARQGDAIDAAQARRLEMRAGSVAQMARRVAAQDHGRIPAARYRQLLHRLDNVDQRLLVDTGSGFNIGDGADGGSYPNG